MRVTSRKTDRVHHVTLDVADAPDLRTDRSSATYTPDRVALTYMDEGAGWRLTTAGVVGLRRTGYRRSSDAWSAKTINAAPSWVRTLAADNMPKDD